MGIKQRGSRPVRLFSETTTSRFPAHPRFSGDEDSETCVRLYINGDSKVDLEIEVIKFLAEGIAQEFIHKTLSTIEDAVEFLGIESSISQQCYELVVTDLRRMRG